MIILAEFLTILARKKGVFRTLSNISDGTFSENNG